MEIEDTIEIMNARARAIGDRREKIRKKYAKADNAKRAELKAEAEALYEEEEQLKKKAKQLNKERGVLQVIISLRQNVDKFREFKPFIGMVAEVLRPEMLAALKALIEEYASGSKEIEESLRKLDVLKAARLWSIYEALKKQGFKEDQAMAILLKGMETDQSAANALFRAITEAIKNCTAG